MTASIIEFREIAIDRLMPHPLAEAFPRDGEDQTSVNLSVGDQGILAPLHVLAANRDGKYLVIDGVTRLLAAMVTERGRGTDQKLPCLLVECDDVATYVMHTNGSRRRVSTGTRVLAYITCHKDAVLAAAAMAGGRVLNMRGSVNGMESNLSKASREAFGGGKGPEGWSAETISERLGVSRDDVRSAIELLRCKELRRSPEMKVGAALMPEAAIDLDKPSGKLLADTIDAQYLKVLGGTSPVRRWKAALGGAVATKGMARAQIKYGDLALRTLTSLTTVCDHWSELSHREQELVETEWCALVPKLPAILRQIMQEAGQ